MENTLESKINKAIQICETENPTKNFNQIYPFTTENILGYLNLFELNDTSLLTVGSSCDQALNAILYGTKDITIYDVCPFVKEYYYLKKTAIESFTKEDFLNFIHYKRIFFHNKNVLNKDMYLSIRNKLKDNDYESYLFWEALYQEFEGLTIKKKLFVDEENSRKVLSYSNLYLMNDYNYERLQSKINNVNINVQSGNIFSSDISGNYDNIFLSNMCSYYHNEQMLELYDKLMPHLNEEGRMLMAYLYYGYELYTRVSELLKKIRDREEKIHFGRFVGITAVGQPITTVEDNVVIYKKTLKK